jgi:polysaccharide biosynthesis/export protein
MSSRRETPCMDGRWRIRAVLYIMAILSCAGSEGCHQAADHEALPANPLPNESRKVILPDYVIEPPDILIVDALRVVPLPPYKAQTQDQLIIAVTNAPASDPISGIYIVETDGTVNLGPSYGSVKVVGLTLAQIKAAVEDQVKSVLKDPPKVVVSVAQTRGVQQIRGEHLVRPDGRISLGLYGSVTVTGLTLEQAKAVIESHLSRYLQSPEVNVDVLAYNSKVFYIIFDLAGTGQQMIRLPITGNDTVLDAISQVFGLIPLANKRQIWVARPAPPGSPCDQILPVDWVGITTRGRTETNYQLLPNDRIFVNGAPLVKLDTYLGRMLAPLERTLGFTLLGTGTIQAVGQLQNITGLSNGGNNNGNNNGNGSGSR